MKEHKNNSGHRKYLKEGEVFNRLTVVKFAGTKGTGSNRKTFYLCKCICGTEKIIARGNLVSKGIRSCGCLKHEAAVKHFKKEDGIASLNRIKWPYIRRAKLKKIKWQLTDSQFKDLIMSPCFYCKKDWSMETRRAKDVPIKHNGVDRKDSKLGYTTENCVPCCKICNWAKNSLTVEEFYEWVQRIYNNFTL